MGQKIRENLQNLQAAGFEPRAAGIAIHHSTICAISSHGRLLRLSASRSVIRGLPGLPGLTKFIKVNCGQKQKTLKNYFIGLPDVTQCQD